jgi:hypothetical protein
MNRALEHALDYAEHLGERTVAWFFSGGRAWEV